MPFPSTSVLDNFNRTEGPPPSSDWTELFGDGLQADGSKCVLTTSTSSTSALWDTTLFPANQEVFADIAAVPVDGDFQYLFFRAQDFTSNPDRYTLVIAPKAAANDVIGVQKTVSGSTNPIGSDIDIGGNFSAGDQVGARAVSTTFYIYLNGSLIATRTDGDITASGYIGIGISGNSAGAWDDFGGGLYVRPLVYPVGMARRMKSNIQFG